MNKSSKKLFSHYVSSTYADLSFVPWNKVALFAPIFNDILWNEYDVQEKFPNFLAWHTRLSTRAAVKRAYGET